MATTENQTLISASTTNLRMDFQKIPHYWKEKNIDLNIWLKNLGYNYAESFNPKDGKTNIIKL